MAPTAWEIQNRLAAILNFARQSGNSYVDVESNSLQKQLANVSNSERSIPLCRDVMIKLMRPGDSILKESPNEQGAAVAIRYLIRKPAENSIRSLAAGRDK
ncbi:MAG: hypothetical protein ACREO5_02490 [Candidatus Binatia bacterium]